MATLYGLGACEGITAYVLTKRRRYSDQEWDQIKHDLRKSCTIYIGNLSFFTTEDQLYELFLMVGPVKSVIMGLNSRTKEPCGFAFVQFYSHNHAKDAVNYISGLKIDSRSIKIDIDVGFIEGRQFGRGRAGGQVRDEFRQDYDYGRGGWGALKQTAITNSGVEEAVIIRPQPSAIADFSNSSMISE